MGPAPIPLLRMISAWRAAWPDWRIKPVFVLGECEEPGYFVNPSPWYCGTSIVQARGWGNEGKRLFDSVFERCMQAASKLRHI
jgi:hypothetical protein